MKYLVILLFLMSSFVLPQPNFPKLKDPNSERIYTLDINEKGHISLNEDDGETAEIYQIAITDMRENEIGVLVSINKQNASVHLSLKSINNEENVSGLRSLEKELHLRGWWMEGTNDGKWEASRGIDLGMSQKGESINLLIWNEISKKFEYSNGKEFIPNITWFEVSKKESLIKINLDDHGLISFGSERVDKVNKFINLIQYVGWNIQIVGEVTVYFMQSDKIDPLSYPDMYDNLDKKNTQSHEISLSDRGLILRRKEGDINLIRNIVKIDVSTLGSQDIFQGFKMTFTGKGTEPKVSYFWLSRYFEGEKIKYVNPRQMFAKLEDLAEVFPRKRGGVRWVLTNHSSEGYALVLQHLCLKPSRKLKPNK
jgi:hypothetical protein